MKNIRNIKTVFASALATLVLAGASSLPAASPSFSAEAEIPFEFTIQDTTLPAGTYRVELQQGANVLYLSTPKSGRLMFLTHPAGDQSSVSQPKLVFMKLGNKAALTEAQFLGAPSSYALPGTPLPDGKKVQIALVSPVIDAR
jgi:hypothetical protein